MSGKLIVGQGLRAAANLRSSNIPTEFAKSSAAFLSAAPSGGKHALPDLAYDYAALEPVISAETMEIHHSKHHNTYVTNLNASLEKLDAAVSAGDVSGIIGMQGALKFNGGGHLNHTLFWENLCPASESKLNDGPLKSLMGDVDALKAKMSASTIAVQGSGWGWLGYNKSTGLLEVATCANQDPLAATTGLVPLLGIDVWEHAYYVDYRNVRPNYVNAIWDIVNWDTVEKRLIEAQK
eukprot:CAMPEP_0198281102 /NCGR_PEP_ID=MMETSP1449-20131203/1097_1 /TAXON_ID=420275 /ORGANISM="Attheya septentrionalis, Strain CCMP2084" /LENGTH=236 /DNA_ID=CAMNT_0043976737 /DNA_START=24 /DNA_END=734 /DNA_ORIENTATION=+